MAERAVARGFWSGTITFGLVSVPVSLFPATRARSVSLRMIAPDGATVQRRYVCSNDDKVLDDGDIVRGYEIEKEKFVIVTDDELEAIEPRKSREIDLQTFVGVEEIDPMYFERAYYLVPAAGSNKAYRLLAEVMESEKRAGIATFVMRGKEYLVAILAENGILRAETLRFDDELRTPADLGLPKKAKAQAADVKKFEREIAKKSGKVNLRDFLDQYAERLEKLAEKKQRRGEDVVKAPVEETEDGGEVIDLLEVLSRSLHGGVKPAGKSRARGKAKPKRRGHAA